MILMYVVEVIPFIRGTQVESLSYYASTSHCPGTLVTIPIRKKEVRGMVIDAKPVGMAKTALKAATFSLRKLPEQTASVMLPHPLIETAQLLSKKTPATAGSILFSLLPPEVRDGSESFQTERGAGIQTSVPEIAVLQATQHDRYRAYRSAIREAFAHRGSVLLVVPTGADVDRAVEELSPGIEARVVTFSPRDGKRKRARAYAAFADMSHAKLVIATARHAFLPRHDLTSIIIEGAGSKFYKSTVRPYLDMRDALKTFARTVGCKLILADIVPQSEDEHARREERFDTYGEHPKRLVFESKLKILRLTDKPTANAPFELFSKELIGSIKKSVAERKHVFLLAAHRGIAPAVACGDCGHIFRCPDSGAPYSLTRTGSGDEERRWFVSTGTGRRVRAADICPACGSWRLRERGIGIQYIYDELAAKFPGLPVTLFDHTTATTPARANELISGFYDTKGGVLLGTPMAVPYIDRAVDYSAIVSLDAARAVPSWRSHEELFSLLLTLRERTRGTVFVQTRTEPDALLEYAAQGQVERFYDDEIEARKLLGYPPFSIFIHLRFEGTSESLPQIEEELRGLLAPAKIAFYSSQGGKSGKRIRNGLIRLQASAWPDEALIERLSIVPAFVRVEIDPYRIV